MIEQQLLADIPDNVVAIAVVALAMLVPIIVVMLRHQQKMAMIFRQTPQVGYEDTVMRLSSEVSELRNLVTQQALAIDNLADGQRRMLAAINAQPIAERLSNEQ
jgi:hypothetical protein